MASAPYIVAGNWKMNTELDSAVRLTEEIIQRSHKGAVQIILSPPFPFLDRVEEITKSLSHISVAAQNCHVFEQGAYTGEVSAAMLSSIGISHVILGHSERRAYFGEEDSLLLDKIGLALSHGLKVIYCCGEQLEDRLAGQHMDVVTKQLTESILALDDSQIDQLIVAYEPVWAIGTGETASPAQAQEMHALIRRLISEKFGPEAGNSISILYGGSVKPDNASELFSQPDVNGGLVGGASLAADSFVQIIQAAEVLSGGV